MKARIYFLLTSLLSASSAMADTDFNRDLAEQNRLVSPVKTEKAAFPEAFRVSDPSKLKPLLKLIQTMPQTPAEIVRTRRVFMLADSKRALPDLVGLAELRGLNMLAIFESFQLLTANGYAQQVDPVFSKWVKQEAVGVNAFIEASTALQIGAMLRKGDAIIAGLLDQAQQFKEANSKPALALMGNRSPAELSPAEKAKVIPAFQAELTKAQELMRKLSARLQANQK